MHFLEIWKFKLIDALKDYYRKKLKKDFSKFDNEFKKELSENKIKNDDIETFKISKENREKLMTIEDEDGLDELDEKS